MTTIHLQVAPRVGPTMPRGARYAAAAFVAMWRWVARLGFNAPARTRTAQEEAQAVRELAWSYRQTDPGFASDLAAAADRHERLHGPA